MRQFKSKQKVAKNIFDLQYTPVRNKNVADFYFCRHRRGFSRNDRSGARSLSSRTSRPACFPLTQSANHQAHPPDGAHASCTDRTVGRFSCNFPCNKKKSRLHFSVVLNGEFANTKFRQRQHLFFSADFCYNGANGKPLPLGEVAA